MNTNRTNVYEAMTSHENVVYIAGGRNLDNEFLDSAEKYEEGIWNPIQSLPAPAEYPCLVSVANNKLLAIGGRTPSVHGVCKSVAVLRVFHCTKHITLICKMGLARRLLTS